jgi:hypothetical protein
MSPKVPLEGEIHLFRVNMGKSFGVTTINKKFVRLIVLNSKR